MIYVWNDIQFRIWYNKQRYVLQYRSMLYCYDIPYDMIYNMYNKICDIWYMIIYYIINDIWIMYEMICNFIYDITKEQYMIYNIQVWYTDMIYHITWYVIHTIRCVQFLRHIGLGQTSCSCCKLTFSAFCLGIIVPAALQKCWR